jgi:hypothetical protein
MTFHNMLLLVYWVLTHYPSFVDNRFSCRVISIFAGTVHIWGLSIPNGSPHHLASVSINKL